MRVTETHVFPSVAAVSLSDEQREWLQAGLNQAGGKLPLYKTSGERFPSSLISSCVQAGLAEPWALNPLRNQWQVCRLTEVGKTALLQTKTEDSTKDSPKGVIRVDFTQWKRDNGSENSKIDYSIAVKEGSLRPDVVRR